MPKNAQTTAQLYLSHTLSKILTLVGKNLKSWYYSLLKLWTFTHFWLECKLVWGTTIKIWLSNFILGIFMIHIALRDYSWQRFNSKRLEAILSPPKVIGYIILYTYNMEYCRAKKRVCCCCSVAQSCPTLCDLMDRSTPGFLVLHHLLELAQTHVHWIIDAIQPSHPLSSSSPPAFYLLFPSPPAFYLSLYYSLFQWIGSLHQVAKVLELQLQHQSFQWLFRIDFL